MTDSYREPEDQSERVEDVVKQAVALSDELQRTLSELQQMMRAEPEGETSE